MPSTGFAAATDRHLPERLDAGSVPACCAMCIPCWSWRAGRIVLERYYTGVDESWGRPLGSVTFGPETLHDLRSVTKSIVGLLYGIALDRGLVPPPDAPLLAQFPEYPDLAADPRRAHLTMSARLNMTLGMEWDEQRPYTDPANSEIAMENAPDRNRFILDRPFVAAPGERWIYSGGAVALVGQSDRQRHRHDVAGLRAHRHCSRHSASPRSSGRRATTASSPPHQACACARTICCASAGWCWRAANGTAHVSCRARGSTRRSSR